jgi:hypothetical protein
MRAVYFSASEQTSRRRVIDSSRTDGFSKAKPDRRQFIE